MLTVMEGMLYDVFYTKQLDNDLEEMIINLGFKDPERFDLLVKYAHKLDHNKMDWEEASTLSLSQLKQKLDAYAIRTPIPPANKALEDIYNSLQKYGMLRSKASDPLTSLGGDQNFNSLRTLCIGHYRYLILKRAFQDYEKSFRFWSFPESYRNAEYESKERQIKELEDRVREELDLYPLSINDPLFNFNNGRLQSLLDFNNIEQERKFRTNFVHKKNVEEYTRSDDIYIKIDNIYFKIDRDYTKGVTVKKIDNVPSGITASVVNDLSISILTIEKQYTLLCALRKIDPNYPSNLDPTEASLNDFKKYLSQLEDCYKVGAAGLFSIHPLFDHPKKLSIENWGKANNMLKSIGYFREKLSEYIGKVDTSSSVVSRFLKWVFSFTFSIARKKYNSAEKVVSNIFTFNHPLRNASTFDEDIDINQKIVQIKDDFFETASPVLHFISKSKDGSRNRLDESLQEISAHKNLLSFAKNGTLTPDAKEAVIAACCPTP